MRVKNGMTQTSIIRSTPRGTTAYIGSRASNRYFRCYDKSAESDGAYPNYSWRWEVEYKKERAWHVAQQVLRGRGSPENIRNIVGQAYFDYGYILPCAPIPMGWRDKGVRAETNDERRLAWLEKSIRPAIEKLSEGVPLGTILAALGLSGLMDGVTGELYTDARKAPVNLYESAVPHPDFEGVYIVSDG
jgi:DNA relaxase NicK